MLTTFNFHACYAIKIYKIKKDIWWRMGVGGPGALVLDPPEQ